MVPCQEVHEDLLEHRAQLDADLLKLQSDDEIAASFACYRYCETLDEYLQVPTLLDPILPAHALPLCAALEARLRALQASATPPSPRERRHANIPARALYTLAKVRGPKQFCSHFPHAVPTLRFLLPAVTFAAKHLTSDVAWHLRYTLFLWSDVAVRAPFPLHTILPTAVIDETLAVAQNAATGAPDRVSFTAAFFLARFLSRSDAAPHRRAVLSEAIRVAAPPDGLTSSGKTHAQLEGSRTCALALLAAFFKLASRADAAPFAPVALELLAAEPPASTATAHRLAKLASRVALTLLPPRPAAWRYTKPATRLFARGAVAGHAGLVDDAAAASAAAATAAPLSDVAEAAAEQVVSHLLEALRHRDTIVRWGASKGVARVTARLPAALAADVASAVLALADDPDETRADAATHGACLCVAELARRGLLLPHTDLFADALSGVRAAARFDLRRGAHSVGAHVRDAACYAVWALARAYAQADIEPYAPEIAAAMLPVALLDREVNCRRAAAAALQECVGRLSDKLFPDGIRLVTLADYFALGDRNAAFVSIAPQVVALANGVYFAPVLQELWVSKLVHWDAAVRELAARSLAKFVAVDRGSVILLEIVPKLVAQATARGEFIFRHGAVLALGELCTAYTADKLQPHIADIRDLPCALNDRGMLSGRTGDEMRVACCKLMKRLAESESRAALLVEEGRSDVEKWLSILERILGCGKEHMYAEATAAYEAVCRSAIARDAEWHVAITKRILSGIQHGKMFELQRGFALAAGACGDSAIIDDVIAVLCRAVKENGDIEVRRNAVRSIGRLAPHLIRSHFVHVLQSLAGGMYDYTTDERGDIGSWVREACLSAVRGVLQSTFRGSGGENGAAQPSADVLASDDAEAALTTVLHAVVEQCCGKIDRVRAVAGGSLESFCALFTDEVEHARLSPTCRQLQKCFRFGDDSARVDFTKAASVLPVMAGALRIDAVSKAALHGVLAGGDGPRAHATLPVVALLDFVESSPGGDETDAATWVLRGVVDLLDARHERLYVPALQVLSACCARDVLIAAPRDAGIAAVRAVRASWRGRQADVKRMIAAVRALEEMSGLSGCEREGLDFGRGSVARECLEALAVVLGSQIPRLRRVAAEAVYMILLRHDGAEVGDGHIAETGGTEGGTEDGTEDGMEDGGRAQIVRRGLDSVGNISWETLTVAQARDHRNALCGILGIDRPVVLAKKAAQSTGTHC